jgi:hypothetical protein
MSSTFQKNTLIIYILVSLFYVFYLTGIYLKVDGDNNTLMVSFRDMNSYLAIYGLNSPLDLEGLVNNFPYHHLTRWLPHFIIGFFGKISQTEPFFAYRFFIYILLLINIFLIYQLKVDLLKRLSYLAFVLLNPYTFVAWLHAPAMIADAIFYTSIIALAVGLFNDQVRYLYLAIILGVISRQTAVLILPLCTLYISRKPNIKSDFFRLVIFTLTIFSIAWLTNRFYLGQDRSGMTLHHITGLYSWIVMPDLGPLKPFLENLMAFFLAIIPLLILIKLRLNYLALIGFLVLASQPILAGPVITGGNVARLVALGLPFLGMILLESKFNTRELVFFIALLMLNGLHHHYTYIFDGYQRIHFLIILGSTTAISWVYYFNKYISTIRGKKFHD